MDYLSSYASLLEQSRLYYPSHLTSIRTSDVHDARNPTTATTESATASFTPFLELGLLNGIVREREIPLDLSTKTVRQTPDSTAADDDVENHRRNSVRNHALQVAAAAAAAKGGHYSYGNAAGATGVPHAGAFLARPPPPMFAPSSHDRLPSIMNGSLLSMHDGSSPYLTPFHHSGVCGGVGGFCLDPQRCRMAAVASLAAAGSTTTSRPHPFMPYSSLASVYERHLTKLVPGGGSASAAVVATSSPNGIQGLTHLHSPKTASNKTTSDASKQQVTMPQPFGSERYLHPSYPLSLPMYHHHHHPQLKSSQPCSCCLSKPFPLSCVCCLPTAAARGYETSPQLLTCYHSPLPPPPLSVVAPKSATDKLEEALTSKTNSGHRHHAQNELSSPKNLDKLLAKKEPETVHCSSKRPPSTCPSLNPVSNKTLEGGRWIPHQIKDDVDVVSPSLPNSSAFGTGKSVKVFAPVAHIPPSPPPPPHRNNKTLLSDDVDDGTMSPSHPYYHFYHPHSTPLKREKAEPFSRLIHPAKQPKMSSKTLVTSSPMPIFGGHWGTMSKTMKLEKKDSSKWDSKEGILRDLSEKPLVPPEGVATISLKKDPTCGELISTSPANGISRSLVEQKISNVVMEPSTEAVVEVKPGQWAVVTSNLPIISKENSKLNVPNERHPKAVKRKHGATSDTASDFASSCSNGVIADAKCNRIKKQPSLRDYKRISEAKNVTEVQSIGVTLVRSSDSTGNEYKSKVLHRTANGNKVLTATSSARSSSMLCRIYGEQIQQWLQGAECTVPTTSSSNLGDLSKERLSSQSNCDDGANRLNVAGGNDTRLLYYDDGDGDDEREDEDEDGKKVRLGNDGVKSRTTIRSKKKRTPKCSEELREEVKKVVATTPSSCSSSNHVENNTKRLMINKALGETALHRAARLGYNEVVAYCLEAETVPIDVRDNAGYTPLHECCSRGHLEIARKLLQHGADVNASAAGGIQPIHDAVENDHVEVVRLLLSYGADPLLATYAGSTPLLLSRSWTMTEFLKGFVSDVSGETDGGIILPWQFHGSATCLDPWPSGYDPLGNLPSDEDEQTSTKSIVEADFVDESESGALLFEVSDKPHITTYRVPTLRGKGSGYCLLNDVLRHTGMARNDFLACYPDIQVEVMSRQEFVLRAESVQLMVDVNASLSAIPSSSTTFVELVQWDDFLREILDIERVFIPR